MAFVCVILFFTSWLIGLLIFTRSREIARSSRAVVFLSISLPVKKGGERKGKMSNESSYNWNGAKCIEQTDD